MTVNFKLNKSKKRRNKMKKTLTILLRELKKFWQKHLN